MNPSDIDEECRRILRLASKSPKTPVQISKLAAIPITRCWERVRFLESQGLLRTVLAFVGKNGRTVRYFEAPRSTDTPEETFFENVTQAPNVR